MRLLLRLVSDLHLESGFGRADVPALRAGEGDVTVLVIAGDAGAWFSPSAPALPPESDGRARGGALHERLFRNVSGKFDHVLFVMGNHEYYGQDVLAAESRMRVLCARHGIRLLCRESVRIAGVLFCGATLWTHLPEDHSSAASFHMKELKRMRLGGRAVTLEDMRELHRKDRDFLSRELGEALEAGDWAVAVTHHSPTFEARADPSAPVSPADAFFCSELDSLLDKATFWLCGHLHITKRHKNLLINARGKEEQPSPGFDPEWLLELPRSSRTPS